MDRRFWVGSSGAMVALPDGPGPVDAARNGVLAVHSGLYGGSTVDAFPSKRSWAWKWDNLPARQIVFLDALQGGMVDGPLRLIDPRRANRLPEQVASGGSQQKSSDGFGVSVGTLGYRSVTAAAASPKTLPIRSLLRGCQRWQPGAGGVGSFYPAGSGNDLTWRLPVLPGETLEVSVWACGVPGMLVTQTWREYSSPTAFTSFSNPAGAQELNSVYWRRLSMLVTPAASSIELSPRVTTTAPVPDGPLFLTGWQVARPDADVLDDVQEFVSSDLTDPGVGWRTGGGAPFVVVPPSGARSYQVPGLTTADLTLLEA